MRSVIRRWLSDLRLFLFFRRFRCTPFCLALACLVLAGAAAAQTPAIYINGNPATQMSINTYAPSCSTAGSALTWNAATNQFGCNSSISASTVPLAGVALGGAASNGGIAWSDAARLQILAGTASANQVLVSGSSSAPSWSSGSSWFDSAYCSTAGYLIVRLTGAWTCSKAIPLPVTWMGATGGGSVDDTSAIQAAITASQDVYLPCGTYKISSALTVANIQKISGAGYCATIMMSNTSQNAINVTSAGAVDFSHFTINASGTQVSGSEIYVAPASGENAGSKFSNLWLYNCWTCIDFEKASQWQLVSSHLIYPLAQAVIVRNTNAPDSGDSIIADSNILYTGSIVAAMVGIYQESSGGLKIIGNKINNASTGYQLNVATGVTSSIVNIVGNSVENCKSTCIQLTTVTPAAGQWRAVQIVGNELMTLTGANGITINAASTPTWLLGVNIVGNSILLNTGSGSIGVYADNSTGVTVADNYFENVPGGNSVGVQFTAAASLGRIAGNVYRSFPAGWAITNASTTTTIDEIEGIAIGNLPAAAANGSRLFLTDGTSGSSPCTGTGTGSTAFRQNGAWKCF